MVKAYNSYNIENVLNSRFVNAYILNFNVKQQTMIQNLQFKQNLILILFYFINMN